MGEQLDHHDYARRKARRAATPTPIQKIQAERKRQIEVKGWTPEHDDTHDRGEMLTVAVMYYQHAGGTPLTLRIDGAPVGFPWDAKWWKPKGPERDFIRAGALCLAERDRLRRIKGSYRGHVGQKLGLIIEALSQLAAAVGSPPAVDK